MIIEFTENLHKQHQRIRTLHEHNEIEIKEETHYKISISFDFKRFI